MRNVRVLAVLFCVAVVSIAVAQKQPPPAAPPPAPTQPLPPTQPEKAPAATNPDVVTRVYNISDLLTPTHEYPFETVTIPPVQLGRRSDESQGGGSNGGGQGAPEQSRTPMNADGILNIITSVVAPDSWTIHGGADGTITVINNLLIVAQSPERQKQVQDLLNQIRRESGPGRTVTVKADWVLLEPGQLQQAMVKQPKNVQVVEIDMDAIAKFHPKAHYTGRISCFNGQTVHVASIRGRTIIRDLQPVVAQNAVGYNADVTIAQAGATLQITPQIAPDGNTATIDVQSLVTEWSEPSNNEMKSASTQPISPESPWSLIDRQSIAAQQLRTTLRLPLGHPVLVGGMTMGPSLTNPDSPQMYLILDVSASTEGD